MLLAGISQIKPRLPIKLVLTIDWVDFINDQNQRVRSRIEQNQRVRSRIENSKR